MTRLVEYVLCVGIKHPKVDSTYSPEMIKRYPKEDHTDFPLHPDIVFFCQPEGCTTAARRISLRQINTFVFTLTDKETNIVRYGICCNFYRPSIGIPQKRHGHLMRSTSNEENTNNSNKNNAAEKAERRKTLPSSPFKPPLKKQQRTSSMICYSLTSICIISSFPFFSTFRECLYVLRKLVESRNANLKDSIHDDILFANNNVLFDGSPMNLPLIECRNWSLLLNSDDTQTSSKVHMDMLEVDHWIKNLLRIPLPVAGLNRVEVELLPRHVQPPLTFALPEKSRFSFADYPVHLPLELLGVETCLKILTCIMLEQKVVLQSRDYNALSISVLSLTSMLYPLEYMFPIIPLLPACMKNAENLLLAPSPFVIGIPSSFFRIKGANFQVPTDIFIVDLDTNKMTVPYNMDEIPALPEPEGSILRDQLKQCLACLSLSPQPIYDLEQVTPLPSSFMSPVKPDAHHLIYGNDIDSVDIAVRCALNKFFCSPNVLGSFVKHSRVLRLYPRPVVALQKAAFVKSRKTTSSFIEALSQTQAVEFFAEWMVNPENTVFKKVQAGIMDPRVIGDKPRWYSHYVQPFYYQVHNPHSHMGFELYEDSDSDLNSDEFPGTIKEEHHQHEANNSCSCCSSYDTDDSDPFEEEGDHDYHSNHQHHMTTINSKIQELYDTSYSAILTEEETEAIQQNIVVNSVFSAPPYRAENFFGHEHEGPLDSVSSTTEEDGQTSATASMETASINESASINETASINGSVVSSLPTDNSTPVSQQPEPKRQIGRSLSALIGSFKPKLASRVSVDSTSSVVSMSSMRTTASTAKPSAIHVNNPRHPLFEERRGSEHHSQINGNSIESNSPDNTIYNSENQQFLTEVAGYVKAGDGVGWLSAKRLRRILVHEGLRQYLVNQLDVDSQDDGKSNTLNDVHISRNVYRGYLELLKLLIEGYENTMRMSGLGGLGSVFQFLEITHRYYCGKRYYDDSTQPPPDNEKKTASRESLLRADESSEKSLSRLSELSIDKDRSINSSSKLNNNNNEMEPPTLSHSISGQTTLRNALSKEKLSNGSSSGVEEQKEKYLVTKSNTSGGFRFNNGSCEKSTFEIAGRGVSGTGRRYLCEGLNRKRTTQVWHTMEFWEYCYLDAVSCEREAAGMDVNQIELIARYKSLTQQERRLLEEDEDDLLAILLHNMVAFMLCMDVDKQDIKRKVRRMLGKSHMGLSQTRWIDTLLDELEKLEGNDIDLVTPRSRQLKMQIFVVHLGDTQQGAMFFLEVREDCIVLKSTNGNIIERWWYENVVNMSCSPKTKVMCIWIRAGEETDLQQICTKKCKTLYTSIKESMQKAAERLNRHGVGVNLGGNFTVVDSNSGQQGKLKVSLEGVDILFVNKKIAIDVRNLKNCCAREKILKVEEYLPLDQTILEHQFFTEEANEICYAILCLFSYVAASKQMASNNGSDISSEEVPVT